MQMMSRLLNDVAASFPLLMMSRLLNDVATLISLQADVATASDSVLMSRHQCSVNCKSYVATSIWCHDLIVHCNGFNSVATSK